MRVVRVELQRAQRRRAQDAVDLGLIRAQLGAQRLQRRIVVGDHEDVEAGWRRHLHDRGHAAEREVGVAGAAVPTRAVDLGASAAVRRREQVVRVDLATRAARVGVGVADERHARHGGGVTGRRARRQVDRLGRQLLDGQWRVALRHAVARVGGLAHQRRADARRHDEQRVRAARALELRGIRIEREAHVDRDPAAGVAELGAVDDRRAATAVGRGQDGVAHGRAVRVVARHVREDEDLIAGEIEANVVAGERVRPDDRAVRERRAVRTDAARRIRARVERDHLRRRELRAWPRQGAARARGAEDREIGVADRRHDVGAAVDDRERREHVEHADAIREAALADADDDRAGRGVDVDRERIAGEVVDEEAVREDAAAAGRERRERRERSQRARATHHGSSYTVAARPAISTPPPASQQVRCR